MQCKECQTKIKLSYGEELNVELKKEQLCSTCHFWNNIVKEETNKILYNSDKNRRVIIDGKCYYPNGYKTNTKKYMLGFSGKEFNIIMNDGTKILTNDLWYNGIIPTHFRNRLPDNAEFIK